MKYIKFFLSNSNVDLSVYMVKKNPPRIYPNPQTITVTIASLKREILTTTAAKKWKMVIANILSMVSQATITKL